MKRVAIHLAVAAAGVAALLAGCASRPTSAPVADRAPAAVAGAKPPVPEVAPVPGATVRSSPDGYYRVRRGDTLYSIALDHGADPRDVREWNRLDNPDRIQPGQVLRVAPPENNQAAAPPPVQVGAARGAGPIDSRPIESRPLDAKPASASAPDRTPIPVGGPGSTVKNEPKALRLPYSNENLAMLQRSEPAQQTLAPAPPAGRPESAAEPKPVAVAPAQPAAGAEAREAESIEFIWPARGKVVAKFAEPASKGMDIAGKPGDPVVAAAGGRVIYIGTGIRGYGKLIVIKHDNNFNSVYAHNREILVKQDQTVTRGQQIAELGDTDADSPKLHFEIRKSGKPVDPAKYLPPS